MFRKLVSQISFSPALVGQLGFYAKRLKKEQTTRRLGLVFVALALVVQSLVVFQPPESANAAASSDFVYGGLGLGSKRSLNNFLAPYDSNATNLRDIMNATGITRAEIASAQFGSFITGDKLGWGREPRAGGTAITVKNSAGTPVGAIYGRPLNVMNGRNAQIYGWIGYSANVGWFAIMQACGNLITDRVPPPVTPPTPPPTPPPAPPTPTPTPPKPANVVLSKSAINATQNGVVASTVTAKESDKITYTITVKNTGEVAKLTTLEDSLDDVVQYATLIDNGGGTFDATKKVLSWPAVELKGGETQVRTFTVQILATIPATPQGLSDPTSYDCVIDNVFGTTDVSIPITCAPPKVIEQITTELPRTGPRENALFAGVVLAVVLYFFLRSKQLGKEVRLIRRDLNSGTIS
ncbi:hypothetical protein H7200_01815 [Candidatus Saccharibacteria bacterium]|nr:hypothetical protein [Candidatus Saccharibacteria bacterium]